MLINEGFPLAGTRVCSFIVKEKEKRDKKLNVIAAVAAVG